VLAAAAFAAVALGATAQTFTVLEGGRRELSEPLLIVAPDYPRNWGKEKPHVEVRVKGTVAIDGRFLASGYSAGPDDGRFVDAVKTVLGEWRFVPAVEGCKAAARDATLLVWFDLKDDRPAIAALIDRDEESPEAKAVAAQAHAKVVRAASLPRIEFPTSMWRRQIEATVMALVKVDPAGSVEEAGLLAYMPVDGFNDTVLAAMRQATFRDAAGACLKADLDFCLQGGGRFNNPRCRGDRRSAVSWY
jgi:hypothetical protein